MTRVSRSFQLLAISRHWPTLEYVLDFYNYLVIVGLRGIYTVSFVFMCRNYRKILRNCTLLHFRLSRLSCMNWYARYSIKSIDNWNCWTHRCCCYWLAASSSIKLLNFLLLIVLNNGRIRRFWARLLITLLCWIGCSGLYCPDHLYTIPQKTVEKLSLISRYVTSFLPSPSHQCCFRNFLSLQATTEVKERTLYDEGAREGGTSSF